MLNTTKKQGVMKVTPNEREEKKDEKDKRIRMSALRRVW
jgi:hypothetical protein